MVIDLSMSIEDIKQSLKAHNFTEDSKAVFQNLTNENFDKYTTLIDEYADRITLCKFKQEDIDNLDNNHLTTLISKIKDNNIKLCTTKLTVKTFNSLYTGEHTRAKFHNKDLFAPLAALFYQARTNKTLNFKLIENAHTLDTALHNQESNKLAAIVKFRNDCYELINGKVGKRAGKALLKAIGVVAAMAAVIFVAAVIGAIMFYPTTLVGFAAIVFAALAAANPAAITITASVGVASLAVGGLAAYGLFKKSAEEKAVDDVVKNAKTAHSADIFEEPTIASRAYDSLTSCFRSSNYERV